MLCLQECNTTGGAACCNATTCTLHGHAKCAVGPCCSGCQVYKLFYKKVFALKYLRFCGMVKVLHKLCLIINILLKITPSKTSNLIITQSPLRPKQPPFETLVIVKTLKNCSNLHLQQNYFSFYCSSPSMIST